MALSASLIPLALLFAQQPEAPAVVQPGAPGQPTVALKAAVVPRHTPTDADVYFMQGMIHHHSQAVEMTDLMPARTHNKALLAFGKRISISQSDEIKYMKQWLEEHGQPTTMQRDMGMAGMDMKAMDMEGMGHSHMKMDSAPMLMPGMLTPEQMKALANAKGATFDRLFLQGMIQHHGGALTMVEDLFASPGAGQDTILYDYATDIDNTQRAEINIMQNMLKEKK